MKPAILIVEDEPGIADTLQYALRTDGFEPHWVATGEAALARQREAPAALVILDVGLPDLNGFEVFKRLREFSDVPVVFLTARSRRDRPRRRPRARRRRLRRQALLAARAGGAACAPSCGARARAPAAPAAPALPFQVDEGRRQIRFYGQLLELSRYEYGLLKTLVERPGHVFTPRRAARQGVGRRAATAWTAPSTRT